MAAEGTLVLARCLRRRAPIVARSARYHSSRPRADLFIAGIASRSTEQKEEVHHVSRWTGSGTFLLVSDSFLNFSEERPGLL